MPDPLRLDCPTISQIPHPDSLAELAVRDRHVVLRFPLNAIGPVLSPEKAELIAHLASRLPEDCKVFDSGGDASAAWITVKRVIPRPVVLEHEEALVDAAMRFRTVATERMHALAAHLSAPLSVFWTGFGHWRPPGQPENGNLSGGWEYHFHGFECFFSHPESGLALDVLLGFENEFGVLDPYFFAGFVARAPGLEKISTLFHDRFHDPDRALEILEERGRLRRVERPRGPGSGLVAK